MRQKRSYRLPRDSSALARSLPPPRTVKLNWNAYSSFQGRNFLPKGERFIEVCEQLCGGLRLLALRPYSDFISYRRSRLCENEVNTPQKGREHNLFTSYSRNLGLPFSCALKIQASTAALSLVAHFPHAACISVPLLSHQRVSPRPLSLPLIIPIDCPFYAMIISPSLASPFSHEILS